MLSFCDLPDPIAKVDGFIYSALDELHQELRSKNWYVREHEIVNLFAFRYLLSRFCNANLDPNQIGIESPVRKKNGPREAGDETIGSGRPKLHARKDLVIWPHAGATAWLGCKPIAVIEWKNSSPLCLVSDKKQDKVRQFLALNGDMMRVGYSISTKRRTWDSSDFVVTCERFKDGKPREFFNSSGKVLKSETPVTAPNRWIRSQQEGFAPPHPSLTGGSYTAIISAEPLCRICKPAWGNYWERQALLGSLPLQPA